MSRKERIPVSSLLLTRFWQELVKKGTVELPLLSCRRQKYCHIILLESMCSTEGLFAIAEAS